MGSFAHLTVVCSMLREVINWDRALSVLL